MTRNPPMSEAKPQRSIILSADEVRAVLAGRKVRIRRPMKLPDNVNTKYLAKWAWDGRPGKYAGYGHKDGFVPLNPSGGIATHAFHRHHILCPYGRRGDQLRVREAFEISPSPGCSFGEYMMGKKHTLTYRADNTTLNTSGLSVNGGGICMDVGSLASEYPMERYGQWRSPALMPAWATRLWPKIKSIRVEKTEAGIWEWVLDVTKASHP